MRRPVPVAPVHVFPTQAESRQIFTQPVGIVCFLFQFPRSCEQAAARFGQSAGAAALADHAGQLGGVKQVQSFRPVSQNSGQQVCVARMLRPPLPASVRHVVSRRAIRRGRCRHRCVLHGGPPTLPMLRGAPLVKAVPNMPMTTVVRMTIFLPLDSLLDNIRAFFDRRDHA